jgi:ELP3 family radical SAM enzyme/protein acetyltransferase
MDIEDIISENKKNIINPAICKRIIKELIQMGPKYYADNETLQKTLCGFSRKYKIMPGKRDLSGAYRELINEENYSIIEPLKNILIKRAVRSDSGIINVSVSMPPENFSCRYNCHFCPNEPGMPRSYLSNEDVFKRATSVQFNAVNQVISRLETLENNGHPIDKLEFRILGGTFSCYPHDVAETFVRDLYFAANIYDEVSAGRPRRQPLSLEKEQAINEKKCAIHVVGMGVETRPDEINENEILRFRRYGITRVEIGVQHTDDNLLKRVNRGHGIKKSKHAIQLLKDYGFKVEIHIMTDLPGATPDGDMECYRQVLQDDSGLIPDYLKDYPCLDVSFTEIKKWREDGRWTPYADKTPDAADLKRVLIYRQSITPPWVRVNRVQRDFHLIADAADNAADELGYSSLTIKPNLAQIVKEEAEQQGIYCQCIRCREVRAEEFDPNQIKFITYSFIASKGLEYFISAEIPRPNRNLLLGFIRMRFSSTLKNSVIPELKGETAMIRELHVYGRVKEVGSKGRSVGAQHLGIGKNLISRCETIAKENAYEQMAIIAGIGVRDYYRQIGYKLKGSYMIKPLVKYSFEDLILTFALYFALFLIFTSLSIETLFE